MVNFLPSISTLTQKAQPGRKGPAPFLPLRFCRDTGAKCPREGTADDAGKDGDFHQKRFGLVLANGAVKEALRDCVSPADQRTKLSIDIFVPTRRRAGIEVYCFGDGYRKFYSDRCSFVLPLRFESKTPDLFENLIAEVCHNIIYP